MRAESALGAVVLVLALLTPATMLLRLAADPGPEPALVSVGPSRPLFEPAPAVRSIAVAASPDGRARATVPTPEFPALGPLALGVRVAPRLGPGTETRLTGRDERGEAISACAPRPVAGAAASSVLVCPVAAPERLRSLTLEVTGVREPLRLEGREHAGAVVAGALYAPPPARDLRSRLELALDRLGVYRPASASPWVLLASVAGSLALAGLAVVALLRSRPEDGDVPGAVP